MTKLDMVRKYVRRERQRRQWSQDDLAEAAGIKSRTTIRKLEDGLKLSEGVEGAVEEALGWKLGSLDLIRSGKEPIPMESPTRYPGDPERQEIWDALRGVNDDMRSQMVEAVIAERRRTDTSRQIDM